MIDLQINVTGQEEIQSSFLSGIPIALRAKLLEAITSSATEVAQQARSSAPVRTGKLASSINVSVKDSPQSVKGTILVSDYIGRFVEGGTNNSAVQVRGYVRHLSGLDSFRTVGKRGQLLKSPKRTHLGIGIVSRYTRSSHLPARPFLQPAFLSLQDRIESRIAAAIESAVQESK